MKKLTPTLANMFLIGTHITKDVSMKLAMYKGFLRNTQTLYPDELESVRTHTLRVNVYVNPDKYIIGGSL